MDLKGLTTEGLQRFYEMYKEEPVFFRHMEDNLQLDAFAISCDITGVVLEVWNDKRIGFVLLKEHKKPQLVHISMMLEKEYRNKGKALEAVKNVMELMYKHGARKIVFLCSRDDKRTMYLLEKLGCKSEARLRSSCYYDGKLHDEIRWTVNKKAYEYKYGGDICEVAEEMSSEPCSRSVDKSVVQL